MRALIETTPEGLYCAPGRFHIDPWRPVDRAVLTHAHGDHTRPGSRSYLCAEPGRDLVRMRTAEGRVETLPYGETIEQGDVRLSLHPAGHILGSAQLRIEHRGEVWVVSGDYKTAPDPTCAPLEPQRCHTFITESTFGLPIYKWDPPDRIFAEVDAWRRANLCEGRTSVLYAYALGKAQRILAAVDPSIGPILVHGAVARLCEAYRARGVELAPYQYATVENARATRGKALLIAPPSAANTPWLRKFGPVSQAMASGWMRIRGARRRRALDRGFALSDHADWDGLVATIDATGAERVLVTHGSADALVRWLRDRGTDASPLATEFEGEEGAARADERDDTQAQATNDALSEAVLPRNGTDERASEHESLRASNRVAHGRPESDA